MGSPSTSTSALGGRLVSYTATGSEGTSFLVPIGATMPSADYEVLYSPNGIENIPFCDLPEGVGDRTTTYFRCNTVAQLAAGEKLIFLLVEA